MSSLDIGPTNVARGSDGTRIGLCLSGGGFRAALYGLGVVRYLAEAGLLGRVKAVSAVSGGSVAAAVLADRWPALARAEFSLDAYLREVEEPFHRAITETNIRNKAIGRWAKRRLSLRGRSRGSAMGDVLVERLLRAKQVNDLDPGLQVILTSTDCATGRAFRVSRDFIGSWDFGYQPVPEGLGLAVPVAASAAVPMLFPPVHLDTAGLGLRNPPPVLSLIDGGVYDNLGLEWFQGWGSGRPPVAREVDFIIVVDASGPFERTDKRLGTARAVLRSRDIQYLQTRATRIRWFVDELLEGKRQGVYLASKYDPTGFKLADGTPIDPRLYDGALPSGFARALSSLRTDLDLFRSEEATLLRYHGYWSVHARLAAFHPTLALSDSPRWRDYAGTSGPDVAAMQQLLESGKKLRPMRRA
jgi:NTE family protein